MSETLDEGFARNPSDDDLRDIVDFLYSFLLSAESGFWIEDDPGCQTRRDRPDWDGLFRAEGAVLDDAGRLDTALRRCFGDEGL